jgi:hypothetical protein
MALAVPKWIGIAKLKQREETAWVTVEFFDTGFAENPAALPKGRHYPAT